MVKGVYRVTGTNLTRRTSNLMTSILNMNTGEVMSVNDEVSAVDALISAHLLAIDKLADPQSAINRDDATNRIRVSGNGFFASIGELVVMADGADINEFPYSSYVADLRSSL